MTALAADLGGEVILSAGADGSLRLYTNLSGSHVCHVWQLPGRDAAVTSLAPLWHPAHDAGFDAVLGACQDGALRLWSERGEVVAELREPGSDGSDPPLCAAFAEGAAATERGSEPAHAERSDVLLSVPAERGERRVLRVEGLLCEAGPGSGRPAASELRRHLREATRRKLISYTMI